jgi:hypothetical protein
VANERLTTSEGCLDPFEYQGSELTVDSATAGIQCGHLSGLEFIALLRIRVEVNAPTVEGPRRAGHAVRAVAHVLRQIDPFGEKMRIDHASNLSGERKEQATERYWGVAYFVVPGVAWGERGVIGMDVPLGLHGAGAFWKSKETRKKLARLCSMPHMSCVPRWCFESSTYQCGHSRLWASIMILVAPSFRCLQPASPNVKAISTSS